MDVAFVAQLSLQSMETVSNSINATVPSADDRVALLPMRQLLSPVLIFIGFVEENLFLPGHMNQDSALTFAQFAALPSQTR